MLDTLEQFAQAEEAMTKIKRFLLAVRRTHTPEASIALATPILRALQERERDILIYLRRSPAVVAGHQG